MTNTISINTPAAQTNARNACADKLAAHKGEPFSAASPVAALPVLAWLEMAGPTPRAAFGDQALLDGLDIAWRAALVQWVPRGWTLSPAGTAMLAFARESILVDDRA